MNIPDRSEGFISRGLRLVTDPVAPEPAEREVDVTTYDAGSVIVFTCVNPLAEAWFEANVEENVLSWKAQAHVVERQFAALVALALLSEDFNVEPA
jgi:hypothetical protein